MRGKIGDVKWNDVIERSEVVSGVRIEKRVKIHYFSSSEGEKEERIRNQLLRFLTRVYRSSGSELREMD